MGRLERLYQWRALCGVMLFLCLALLGTPAPASVAAMQEAKPLAAAAMASRSMPGVLDCAPCAGCYVGPAPTTHGFSGECKDAEAPAWREHGVPLSPTIFHDTGSCRPPLPVRIAYCRWLD
ncbi:MAG: hypothetical protein ACRECD_13400 [Burkholderiaceae bacterium]